MGVTLVADVAVLVFCIFFQVLVAVIFAIFFAVVMVIFAVVIVAAFFSVVVVIFVVVFSTVMMLRFVTVMFVGTLCFAVEMLRFPAVFTLDFAQHKVKSHAANYSAGGISGDEDAF